MILDAAFLASKKEGSKEGYLRAGSRLFGKLLEWLYKWRIVYGAA
jgi:hypothetical protein